MLLKLGGSSQSFWPLRLCREGVNTVIRDPLEALRSPLLSPISAAPHASLTYKLQVVLYPDIGGALESSLAL